MSRTNLFAEAALVLVTPLLVRAEPASQALRWKFQVGDQSEYVLERSILGKVDFEGNTFEFAMSLSLDLGWKVELVRSEGDAEITQVVRHVKLTLKSPVGGSLSYDSRMGSEPRENLAWTRIGPRLAALRAEPARLVVSPLGQVVELQLPPGLAGAAEPAGPADEERTLGASGFSEDSIRNLLRRAFVPLPTEPVGSGVRWTDQFEMTLGEFGTQTTIWEYSLAPTDPMAGGSEGPQGGVETRLVARSLVTIVPALEATDVKIAISEQRGVGTIRFDALAGRASAHEFDQRIVLAVTVNDNPFVQEVRDVVKLTRRKNSGKP